MHFCSSRSHVILEAKRTNFEIQLAHFTLNRFFFFLIEKIAIYFRFFIYVNSEGMNNNPIDNVENTAYDCPKKNVYTLSLWIHKYM